jgi:hypothetical protein
VTTKSKTEPAAETKSKTEPAAADTPPTPAKSAAVSDQCVVNDGKPHVGRAVMGKVCSYHAMHYRPDGSPRG